MQATVQGLLPCKKAGDAGRLTKGYKFGLSQGVRDETPLFLAVKVCFRSRDSTVLNLKKKTQACRVRSPSVGSFPGSD